MIWVSDNLALGGHDDTHYEDVLCTSGIDGLLNVAQDLPPRTVWPLVDYCQVGLIDGPGNEPSDYCASLLALSTLLRRCKKVMVYDHDGRRALVVVIAYLIIKHGRVSEHISILHGWKTWRVAVEELENRLGVQLPVPHDAHISAIDNIPFGLMECLI